MSASSDATRIDVVVCSEAFDPGAELNRVCLGDHGSGASACFIGMVRDLNLRQQVSALHLEHYPGMTERALQQICQEAAQRWSLRRIRVIHRYGDLHAGEPIVGVWVNAEHRAEAFDGCAFIMDFLKTRAPFWKRETRPDGSGHWIDARASDDMAAHRWTALAVDTAAADDTAAAVDPAAARDNAGARSDG